MGDRDDLAALFYIPDDVQERLDEAPLSGIAAMPTLPSVGHSLRQNAKSRQVLPSSPELC
jgi:hypothetical protein